MPGSPPTSDLAKTYHGSHVVHSPSKVPDPLILYGAGGHARVVLDALACSARKAAWIVDDHPRCDSLDGVEIIAAADGRWLTLVSFRFVVGIGDNCTRAAIFERLLVRGGIPLTVVHPASIVSDRSFVGPGTVLMAGAIVNPGASIGMNCILNTACSVDHDCLVGDHVHLCPGVRVAGGVRIGSGTMLGTGACVTPGRSIGSGVVIGAGAVVVRDLPDNCSAYGNPARVHRFLSTLQP